MVERGQKAKPGEWASLVGACAVAILLIVGFEVQKHREGRQGPGAASAEIARRSPEADLAAIQLGHRPRRSNSTLKRLASLLDILEADCPANTRRDLADLTVNSLRDLEHSGISAASPTQILGGVLGSEYMGAASDCSRFFKHYVTLRRHEG